MNKQINLRLQKCRRFLKLSSLHKILYIAGEVSDTYYMVYEKRNFASKKRQKLIKRTNFPKICSFYIDSSFRILYPTILAKE